MKFDIKTLITRHLRDISNKEGPVSQYILKVIQHPSVVLDYTDAHTWVASTEQDYLRYDDGYLRISVDNSVVIFPFEVPEYIGIELEIVAAKLRLKEAEDDMHWHMVNSQQYRATIPKLQEELRLLQERSVVKPPEPEVEDIGDGDMEFEPEPEREREREPERLPKPKKKRGAKKNQRLSYSQVASVKEDGGSLRVKFKGIKQPHNVQELVHSGSQWTITIKKYKVISENKALTITRAYEHLKKKYAKY